MSGLFSAQVQLAFPNAINSLRSNDLSVSLGFDIED